MLCRSVCSLLLLVVIGSASVWEQSDSVVPESTELVEHFGAQFIGTHNSYHVKPTPYTLGVLKAAGLGKIANEISYTHKSIRSQIESGANSFELDLFADPKGGRYAIRGGKNGFHPYTTISAVMAHLVKGLKQAGVIPAAAPPGQATEKIAEKDYQAMQEPGMKVFHIQDIDFHSNCGPTLKGCLKQIHEGLQERQAWVLIEIKDKPPSTGNPGIDRAIPWAKAPEMDAELWESLEEELNEVPSSIKFLMDNDDLAMPYAEWCSGSPKCTKRIHINARKLSAAQEQQHRGNGIKMGLVCNDPRENCKDGKTIKQLADTGKYIIRTRADSDVKSFNANRAQAALNSGATIVHTDFLEDITRLMNKANCDTCTDGQWKNGQGHTCQDLRAHANGGRPDWTDIAGTKASEACAQFKCTAQCTCKITKHDVPGATCSRNRRKSKHQAKRTKSRKVQSHSLTPSSYRYRRRRSKTYRRGKIVITPKKSDIHIFRSKNRGFCFKLNPRPAKAVKVKCNVKAPSGSCCHGGNVWRYKPTTKMKCASLEGELKHIKDVSCKYY